MTPRMTRRAAPIPGDGSVGRPRAHGGRVGDHGELSTASTLERREPKNLGDMGDAREKAGFAKGGWIAGAIKHPGAEKRAAAKAGMSTHGFMERHKSDAGKPGDRARLGLRLSAMAKSKG